MTKKHLHVLRDFSKGINDKKAPNLIPDNALADAENAIIGSGSVSKRYGYEMYSSLANTISHLYKFYRNNGTREVLATSDNTLYKDTNGVLTAVTGATLTSNEAKTVVYKSRGLQDVLLIADKGGLKVYNGVNVSNTTPYSPSSDELTDPGSNDLVNLTNFRAIAIKQDRIYAAAHPTVKNRLSFSHHDPNIGFATFDYWPAPFFIDVAVEDNDEIIELKVFRDALIIFCKRSVWALYGDGRTIADYQLKKINVPSGCIAPNSVQTVGNNIFYLSNHHVYSLYSTDENFVSAEIVSENMEKALKSQPRPDMKKAVGCFHDNKYYLSFPNGVCLVYDIFLKAWTKWTNVQANSFLEVDGKLLFASGNYIHEFKNTIYHDNGNPIPFSMRTKIMDLGYDVQDKKFRNLWIILKQFDNTDSTFDLRGMIDHYAIINLLGNSGEGDANISAKWDSGVWDEDVWDFAEVIQKELKIRERGKNIQLVITNEKDEPLTIYGIAFQFKVKRP